MKRCRGCNRQLPHSEFHRDQRSSDGLARRCKDCVSEYQRSYYQRRKDRRREQRAAWRRANPERERAIKRRAQIRATGLEPEAYYSMLEEQGGMCAICGKDDGPRRLAVAHCHATGEVRGLLCTRCNQGLGQFLDDVDRLQSAIEYLERSVVRR